jgi:hypothetical protein
VSEMSEPGIRQAHRSGLDHRDNEFRCFPWGVAMDAVVPKRNAVGVERFRVTAETPRERHALAALTLYGQPYSPATPETVRTLRWIAHANADLNDWQRKFLRDHADKLAALLPPDRSGE